MYILVCSCISRGGLNCVCSCHACLLHYFAVDTACVYADAGQSQERGRQDGTFGVPAKLRRLSSSDSTSSRQPLPASWAGMERSKVTSNSTRQYPITYCTL